MPYIYNSRNYTGLLNDTIDVYVNWIYNSRNYIGLLNGLQKLADYQQRGIFILAKPNFFYVSLVRLYTLLLSVSNIKP